MDAHWVPFWMDEPCAGYVMGAPLPEGPGSRVEIGLLAGPCALELCPPFWFM